MSFTIYTCDQRSDLWRKLRAGRVTGSRVSDMLATIKSGKAASRRDYRTQLVVERLTGEPQDDMFINAAMQRGIDKEPEARLAYEAVTGTLVEQTGFLAHDGLLAGCSLDGHIGDFEGLLELKVPKSATHYGYLSAQALPAAYQGQVMHALWMVPQAQWLDFASFDDRFPADLRLFVTRVYRKDFDLATYESTLRLFLDSVEQEHAAVLRLREPAPVM